MPNLPSAVVMSGAGNEKNERWIRLEKKIKPILNNIDVKLTICSSCLSCWKGKITKDKIDWKQKCKTK